MMSSKLPIRTIVRRTMCMKTECSTCKKPTWKGCGKHIDSALQGVPHDQRCKCKACTQAEYNANPQNASGCVVQ